MADRQKLWSWQIAFLNGRLGDIASYPVDYSRIGAASAVIRGMYVRGGDFVVEVETIAGTRTEAERMAQEAFDRDVPDDMRGQREDV